MEILLKVLSDMDCSLFIDGEFVQIIKADSITKIPLRRGEYFVQCISTLDSTISQSEEILLEYDRIYKVPLIDRIIRNKDSCEKLELEPRKNNDGLFGYYLKGTSKCIIPHRYENASEFISLYAIVSDGKTRSVIGKNGKVLIPFGIFSNIILDVERDEVLGFHVYKREIFPGGWGYISIKYDFIPIAECIYCKCMRFDDFLVCKKENGNNADVIYSLKNGEERLRADEIRILSDPELPGHLPHFLLINTDGLYGIIDNKLNPIIPNIFKAYDIHYKGEPDLWGNSNELLEENPYYTYVLKSNEQFITADPRVGIPLGIPYMIRYLDGKKCFVSANIDVTELQVSTLSFYRSVSWNIEDIRIAILVISHYSYTPNLKTYLKGNSRAKKKKTATTILMFDSSGQKQINADSIDHFFNDFAIVTRHDKKTFVDLKGNFLTDFKYVSMTRFHNGVSVVSDGKGYGAINTKGQEIIQCKYKSITYSDKDSEGILIAFDNENKETHFNKGGDTIEIMKNNDSCQVNSE